MEQDEFYQKNFNLAQELNDPRKFVIPNLPYVPSRHYVVRSVGLGLSGTDGVWIPHYRK